MNCNKIKNTKKTGNKDIDSYIDENIKYCDVIKKLDRKNYSKICKNVGNDDHPLPQLCKSYTDLADMVSVCGETKLQKNPDLSGKMAASCDCIYQRIDITKKKIGQYKAYAQCRYSDTPAKNVNTKLKNIELNKKYATCEKQAKDAVDNEIKKMRCKPTNSGNCGCEGGKADNANSCALSKNLDKICIPCQVLNPKWGSGIPCDKSVWGSFSDFKKRDPNSKNIKNDKLYQQCENACDAAAGAKKGIKSLTDKVDGVPIAGAAAKAVGGVATGGISAVTGVAGGAVGGVMGAGGKLMQGDVMGAGGELIGGAGDMIGGGGDGILDMTDSLGDGLDDGLGDIADMTGIDAIGDVGNVLGDTVGFGTDFVGGGLDGISGSLDALSSGDLAGAGGALVGGVGNMAGTALEAGGAAVGGLGNLVGIGYKATPQPKTENYILAPSKDEETIPSIGFNNAKAKKNCYNNSPDDILNELKLHNQNKYNEAIANNCKKESVEEDNAHQVCQSHIKPSSNVCCTNNVIFEKGANIVLKGKINQMNSGCGADGTKPSGDAPVSDGNSDSDSFAQNQAAALQPEKAVCFPPNAVVHLLMDPSLWINFKLVL